MPARLRGRPVWRRRALHSFGGMAVANSGSGKRRFGAEAACDPRLGRDALENILGESPGDCDPCGCSFLLLVSYSPALSFMCESLVRPSRTGDGDVSYVTHLLAEDITI